MATTFSIEIEKFQKISAIKNAWNSTDYKALLISMGLDESDLVSASESDLKEMCKMSLADFEPHESAQYVMSYLIKDSLSEGKIDQISHDMIDDNLWEQFADLSYHKRFFDAYGLLREAYNGTFSEPTGVLVHIKVHSQTPSDFEVFDTSLEAAMTRALASAMEKNEVLNRLYEEQIAGESFQEARNILWHIQPITQSENEREYEIISSYFWLGGLENVTSFEATTHADAASEEE